MIKDNESLAMAYRDAELWRKDFPTAYGNVDNGKCSKCGESLEKDSLIGFSVPGSHGPEHYDYHKECVVYALRNASYKQKSIMNA